MQTVITGMGVFGAGYATTQDLRDRLQRGQSCITYHQQFTECDFPGARIGAVLSPFDFTDAITRYQKKAVELTEQACRLTSRRSLSFQCLVLAALQAWLQAGLVDCPYPPNKLGLIIAGNNLLQQDFYKAQQRFTTAPCYVGAGFAQQSLETALVSVLSELLTIRGCGFTLGAAMASGLYAIEHALHLLAAGLECVMVAAPIADLSPPTLQAFHNAQLLAGQDFIDQPAAACRPFDKAACGFILGQGAGCLILEKHPAASARQQAILAEILACTSLLDGQYSARTQVDQQMALLNQALQLANLTTVDYVCTHGTGTPLGDQNEAQALHAIFGDRPWVNATKALLGHTLWASGVIETITTVLQMQYGFLHGNPNLADPIRDDLNWLPRKASPHTVQSAMKLAYGFGGFNAAIVLGQPS